MHEDIDIFSTLPLSEIELELFIRDANIGAAPHMPPEFWELIQENRSEIRKILVSWGVISMLYMNGGGVLWGLGILGVTLFLALTKTADFEEKKLQMELRELHWYYSKIIQIAVPFIKSYVDMILIKWEEVNATDEDISFAIISLRNYFFQHDWQSHFILARDRCPYIEEWEQVLDI